MSSEVENNKEEEVKEQKPRKTLKDVFKENCLLGLKLLELLICCICVGFSYEPLSNDNNISIHYLHHIGVMYTAFTGYMVINSIMIIGKVIGDRIPFRTASIFAAMGAALFLLTGILLAYIRAYYQPRHTYLPPRAYLLTMLTTSIVFAFVNSLIFVVETVLTFTRQVEF